MRTWIAALMLSGLFLGGAVAGEEGGGGACGKECLDQIPKCCRSAVTAVIQTPGTWAECCGQYVASFKDAAGKVQVGLFGSEKDAERFAKEGIVAKR